MQSPLTVYLSEVLTEDFCKVQEKLLKDLIDD